MLPEWRTSYVRFEAYIQKHLGDRPTPKHSLGRINNNKGYIPDNLKWETAFEQCRNQRKNHLVFWKGNWVTLAELSEKTGIPAKLLRHRLAVQKLSVEEALRRPIENGGRFIEWNGRYHSISTWSRILNINIQTLYSRLFKLGWTTDKAFTS